MCKDEVEVVDSVFAVSLLETCTGEGDRNPLQARFPDNPAEFYASQAEKILVGLGLDDIWAEEKAKLEKMAQNVADKSSPVPSDDNLDPDPDLGQLPIMTQVRNFRKTQFVIPDQEQKKNDKKRKRSNKGQTHGNDDDVDQEPILVQRNPEQEQDKKRKRSNKGQSRGQHSKPISNFLDQFQAEKSSKICLKPLFQDDDDLSEIEFNSKVQRSSTQNSKGQTESNFNGGTFDRPLFDDSIELQRSPSQKSDEQSKFTDEAQSISNQSQVENGSKPKRTKVNVDQGVLPVNEHDDLSKIESNSNVYYSSTQNSKGQTESNFNGGTFDRPLFDDSIELQRSPSQKSDEKSKGTNEAQNISNQSHVKQNFNITEACKKKFNGPLFNDDDDLDLTEGELEEQVPKSSTQKNGGSSKLSDKTLNFLNQFRVDQGSNCKTMSNDDEKIKVSLDKPLFQDSDDE